MTVETKPKECTNVLEDEVVEYQFGDILNIGIIFVVAGLTLTYGADIVDDISGDFTANSAAANITGDTLGGLDALSSKMPTLGKIAVAAIIIGVLVGAFAMRR